MKSKYFENSKLTSKQREKCIYNNCYLFILKDWEKVTSTIIQKFKKPLVSTSANISGSPSPQHFADISREITDAVDYIVEWKQDDLSKSLPSKV